MTESASNHTCFDIKSAHLGLVALVIKTLDVAAFAHALHQRFADFPDFFDQDAVALDMGEVIDDNTVCSDIDWPTWLNMLKRYNMQPLAVRGVPESWKQQLIAHNLAWMPKVAAPVGSAPAAVSASASASASATAHVSTSAAAPSVQSESLRLPAAMVVDKPLRSGQRVYAKGGDLVVLAMVNPGAEVIADGHIHVYAPLRGRAVAGARGDTSARIFALNFEPELVSIAGVYQSIDGDLPAGVAGAAACVSLSIHNSEERLIYQAISR